MGVRLAYDKGSIIIQGDVHVPFSRWDERSRCYRALGFHYRDMLSFLEDFEVEDLVLDLIPSPGFELKAHRLRDYQRKAVDAWLIDKRGVVVLPTGAGKTLVAVHIIAELGVPALIVAPTLDLVDQWRKTLRESFNVDVGCYCGGEKTLRPLTVATYDSAYLQAEYLGNKFMLLVFDEVHHLPSEGYRQIAELSAVPYRLGLTATYAREDGLHSELPRLVGGVVYEEKISKLAGKHLADYRLERINTELTGEERAEYDRNYSIYLNFLRSSGMKLRTPRDFRFFVMRSGRDPKAREALLARNRARMIALNSESKMHVLSDLLDRHRGDRVIIFTEHNDLVKRISRRFLIPSITHKTQRDERVDVLSKFRDGVYSKIVSSRVLDEGVDVPEASIGVILSGSGSKRAFTQRLGRILRKKDGKKAILYEVVSKETGEVHTSYRRKSKDVRK